MSSQNFDSLIAPPVPVRNPQSYSNLVASPIQVSRPPLNPKFIASPVRYSQTTPSPQNSPFMSSRNFDSLIAPPMPCRNPVQSYSNLVASPIEVSRPPLNPKFIASPVRYSQTTPSPQNSPFMSSRNFDSLIAPPIPCRNPVQSYSNLVASPIEVSRPPPNPNLIASPVRYRQTIPSRFIASPVSEFGV